MKTTRSRWNLAALGDVATIVRGVTYKKSDVRPGPASGRLALLRATNIEAGRLLLDAELLYIPERYVSEEQRLIAGDIVVAASSGSIDVVGKSAQLRADWNGTFGAFCTVLRPSPSVLPAFLSLYVQSAQVRQRWSNAARGTNINNLKRGDLTDTPVPLPSLAEQHQIVERLEDHLSRLDAAENSLRAARSRADALISRLVEDVVNDPTLPRHPLRFVLAEASDGGLIDQGWSPRCPREPAIRGEWGVLTTTAIQFGGFDPSSNKRLPPTLTPRESLQVRPGDLLMTRAGPRSRCGVLCVVEREAPKLMLSDKMYRFRPDPTKATSQYIAMCLASPSMQKQIDRAKTGINDSGVNLTQDRLLRLEIPVPGLASQDELTQRVVRAAEYRAQLVAEMDRASARSRLLRSALFKEAFVPEDGVDQ